MQLAEEENNGGVHGKSIARKSKAMSTTTTKKKEGNAIAGICGESGSKRHDINLGSLNKTNREK